MTILVHNLSKIDFQLVDIHGKITQHFIQKINIQAFYHGYLILSSFRCYIDDFITVHTHITHQKTIGL